MKQILEPIFESAIETSISESDDLEFWLAALNTLLCDFKLLYLDESKSHNIFLQIGACSHWLRPRQTRLTHTGGFAYPAGYLHSGQSRRGLPEFDWFVLFYREQKEGTWMFYGFRKVEGEWKCVANSEM